MYTVRPASHMQPTTLDILEIGENDKNMIEVLQAAYRLLLNLACSGFKTMFSDRCL